MTAPRRILLLDSGNEWGGGTNSMFELLKRIDRRRFAVTCCFYKDYRRGERGRLLSEELAAIGIPLLILPARRQPLWAKLTKELARGVFAWSASLRKRLVLAVEMRWRIAPRVAALAKILAEGDFELLYMNNQPASNLEGYLAGEAAGVPVVQHCRIEPTLQPAEVAVVNRIAARVICVSQGVAEVLAALKVEENLLSVVHNAIDCRAPMPLPVVLDSDEDELVVGTVGQLTARKGVMDLLRAIVILREAGVRIRCLVLGEGPQRAELEAEAARVGVAGEIRFLGFQAVPLAWVQAMDVVVLCSSREGLPRVVLEAMLAGKPVIGSDVTGTRELVVNEETGLLYPCGDVGALAAALGRLAGDPAARARMGQAGYARVCEGFSIESYVAGVSALLAEVLAESDGTGPGHQKGN